MDTVITPRVGGGHISYIYWVCGSNLFPFTRVNSIQDWRPNEFHNASIIAKNCTEGLLDEKNISLGKSKSKITLTSWIVWIWYYMEDNGMDTVFHFYYPYFKPELYLLN